MSRRRLCASLSFAVLCGQAFARIDGEGATEPQGMERGQSSHAAAARADFQNFMLKHMPDHLKDARLLEILQKPLPMMARKQEAPQKSQTHLFDYPRNDEMKKKHLWARRAEYSARAASSLLQEGQEQLPEHEVAGCDSKAGCKCWCQNFKTGDQECIDCPIWP
eukprot:TRINITY_DN54244_c1_g1_i1.p2 TRINITY_DN54244_c1_g1~~TRINITY_DN54244_c1_g1_i1.p2  ORF type:complete len:164 (-),score=34.55 TRINITY_DN54244_c1_g1_i1:16-507(-)